MTEAKKELGAHFGVNLDERSSAFLGALFDKFHFSFQQKKQLAEFASDFEAWDETPVYELLADGQCGLNFNKAKFNKAGKVPNGEQIFNFVREAWLELKSRPHSYASFKSDYAPKKFEISSFRADRIALGRCPVASENTRCCNLLTLDSVNSCGFDCSYCAIGSFYKHGKIGFDENFAANLARLRLDPARSYHIGTGQSSDSLMWGDRFGILSALTDFAARHQNVILELKSKSNNIRFFLQREIPRNLIVTFSLNTPAIIANEEHLSASLDARLAAAEALAARGILVGFHLHPMVWYEGWRSDYGALFERLLRCFDPSDVAMVSLGTLTFIKPVVKKLRSRGLRSKILQMPLADANGKLSYPPQIKRELFKFAADALFPWRERVFFYLCMEDASLWREVLGCEYESNDAFEEAMKAAYFAKIRQR
ncbi:spore photoproduct lyase family protein [Campylobacter sp.]|uniref:spore photoproduct lyase family protein n=1 Tax=Campylobacter sp. TaxID=205 RepID=UPI0027B891CC|nr:hypothetical protein [Campylobacter sp.]